MQAGSTPRRPEIQQHNLPSILLETVFTPIGFPKSEGWQRLLRPCPGTECQEKESQCQRDDPESHELEHTEW